jgi:hypothetical protein
MKFEEVLPLLREGKYVKRKSWKDAKFAHRDCAFVTFDKDILDGDDWELYNPRTYMNFLDAVKVARETGKKMYLKSSNDWFEVDKSGTYTTYAGGDSHHLTSLGYDQYVGDWYVE